MAYVKITYKDQSESTNEILDKVIVSVESDLKFIEPSITREDLSYFVHGIGLDDLEKMASFIPTGMKSSGLSEFLKDNYIGEYSCPETFIMDLIRDEELPELDESWWDFVDFDEFYKRNDDYYNKGEFYFRNSNINDYVESTKLELGDVFTFDKISQTDEFVFIGKLNDNLFFTWDDVNKKLHLVNILGMSYTKYAGKKGWLPKPVEVSPRRFYFTRGKEHLIWIEHLYSQNAEIRLFDSPDKFKTYIVDIDVLRHIVED